MRAPGGLFAGSPGRPGRGLRAGRSDRPACAPRTPGAGAEGDERTGTLRGRRFREVGDRPEEQAADAVVTGIEKTHEGAKAETEHSPVRTRARRVEAALHDPRSAPDLIGYATGAIGSVRTVDSPMRARSSQRGTRPGHRRSRTRHGAGAAERAGSHGSDVPNLRPTRRGSPPRAAHPAIAAARRTP
ncbi:hypothetical protein [Streptomyces sp. NBC_00316]|uniref:hypothetical protein n=1 Tax=Streptomyces sp. NBC_00316 TaxID=2975710 RepID=UPI002E29F5C1|nr:hypothetical protein [Streptomyces sp. NBC_00316]